MKQTNNQQHANHRAQGIIRKFIVLVILVLTCTNCQVDEQVLKSNEAHNGADKGEIVLNNSQLKQVRYILKQL